MFCVFVLQKMQLYFEYRNHLSCTNHCYAQEIWRGYCTLVWRRSVQKWFILCFFFYKNSIGFWIQKSSVFYQPLLCARDMKGLLYTCVMKCTKIINFVCFFYKKCYCILNTVIISLLPNYSVMLDMKGLLYIGNK